MIRARIVLGKKESDKLRNGESLIVRLRNGDELEIVAGMLFDWGKPKFSEGSIESIIGELRRK